MPADAVDVSPAGSVFAEGAFTHYQSVCDLFLRSDCEMEVNVNATMRKKALSLYDKSVYASAREDQRRTVLDPPAQEIEHMMSQNFFAKFLSDVKVLNILTLRDKLAASRVEAPTTAEATPIAAEEPWSRAGPEGKGG